MVTDKSCTVTQDKDQPKAHEDDLEMTPLLHRKMMADQTSAGFHMVGFALTCLAVSALCVQQEVMQSAESKGTVDKPSFTIWWNHSCLILGLPAALLFQGSASPARLWHCFLARQEWSASRALGISLFMAVLFFLPNLAWAITLKTVWVPLVTAASRFDSFFVLLFLSAASCQAPPWKQSLAVVACIAGVILISFGQHSPLGASGRSTTTWEYFEVFISPCLSAMYIIIFNRLTKGNASDPMTLCTMLGLIGLCNVVVLWPAVPIMEVAGFEPQPLRKVLTMPGAIKSVMVNAALATVGNFSQMPATALTGPLFVSLGMLLVMPVTVLVDWLAMHHTGINPQVIFGCLAICCGAGFSILVEASQNHSEPAEARPLGSKVV